MVQDSVKMTLVGGPTALIEITGFRLLTDPTFDPGGSQYTNGPITLRKLAGPALGADAVGRVNAVLLSHDQHFDNLDHTGRAMLACTRSVITTPSGSRRLGGNAVGLKPWQSTTVAASDGGTLRVTATPARHGPPGIEAVSGEVTGFVLTPDGLPRDAIYVSGDTVWFEGVAEVARRHDVAVALLFMGSAKLKERGPAALTMTAADGIEAARTFPRATIVPVHYQGWAHFSESRDDITQAFAAAGLSAQLRLLDPGQSITLTLLGSSGAAAHSE
jgi:L-ascorbate metabolism protein UlaG (beta-lactamase superfamily)